MGILSKLKGFFIGGTSAALTETAGGIADIVERWKPGEGKKHERTMEIQAFLEKSYDAARKHDQPMSAGIPLIDSLVNGVNRLIRPWVTITVIGGLFDYWTLPAPDTVPQQYWDIAMIILGFWFGGRFLVKDIPQAIKSVVK